MIIDILGHNYEVKERDDLGDQMGRCNLVKGIIDIDKELSPDVKAETLNLEVMEGINFWGDLHLEHHQISLISAFQFGTLAQNKEFRDYLWRILRKHG
jgi:hypothetical protein